MTEVQIAYLAGFFDGEGTIGIYTDNGSRYVVRISLSNTSKESVYLFKQYFGGCVFTQKRNEQKPTWRTVYRWQIGNTQADRFFEIITPYLRLKYRQAKLAIQFRARRNPLERLGKKRRLDEADRLLMSIYNGRCNIK